MVSAQQRKKTCRVLKLLDALLANRCNIFDISDSVCQASCRLTRVDMLYTLDEGEGTAACGLVWFAIMFHCTIVNIFRRA